MARLPQIAETAERTQMPSARYSVRSASGADFGGQVGAAVQQLGGAVQNVSDNLGALEAARAADARKLQDFKRQTNFIQFSTNEQAALIEARQGLADGGWEFQKNFVLGHAERAQEWLDQNAITDPEEREQWLGQLARLRSGLSTEALGAEFQERSRFYTEQTNVALDDLRTGIDQRPDAFETYMTRGVEIIRSSGLSEREKLTREVQWERDGKKAFGLALVQRDPAAALEALGGPTTEAGDYSGPTGAAKGDFDYFRSQGLSGVQAAGVLGVLSWESGGGEAGINPRGRNRGDGRDGSDSIGAAQWNAERADALKAFAAARGKGWDDKQVQLEFVMHEMRTTEGVAYRRLMAAQTIEQAVEAMNYYERPRNHRSGGDPTKVIHWNERVARATFFAGSVATETKPPSEVTDPRLQGLGYEDRLQLIGAASRGVQQQVQAAARQQQAVYESQLNNLQVGLLDGTAGREDIEAARSAGWLTDGDDISKLNNIVEANEKKNEDLNIFNVAFSDPNFQWNPYDREQKDAVDAAFQNNPAALESIVARTGIVPPAAVSGIRGALVSSDPARVLGAARLASNAMKGNANAFTPFEGGKDIEQAALTFDFYTETLGLSAEEAGARLVQDNDPERQGQIRPNAERVREFSTVARDTPVGSILGAIPGGRARVRAAVQEEALRADYIALAEDNFRRYGNEAQARDAARRGISRLYGVSRNGTFTKYPPEKAYPAANGSHDYVYAQAASTVRNAIDEPEGFDERKVFLMPVPTLTAEAWRTGSPLPYQIGYVFERDGQQVYDILPGSYRFNPPAARPTRSEQTRFERARERRDVQRQFPGRSLPGMPGVGGNF